MNDSRSTLPRTAARWTVRVLMGVLLALPLACGPAGAGDEDEPQPTPADPADPEQPAEAGEPPAPVPPGGGGSTGTPSPASAGFVQVRATPGPQAGEVDLFLEGVTAEESAAGYHVRASVTHPAGATVSLAPRVQHVERRRGADGVERLRLSGLERGRVLQFTVWRATEPDTPLAPAVASRVTGSWRPPEPARVIPVTQPGTLDQEGATYRLMKDITAGGTAFRIAARGITLDLAGYTITYGSTRRDSHGVDAAYLYNRGTTTIVHGTIRQAGGRSDCDAIHLRGGHDIRISQVHVTVQGADCDGINVWDGVTGDVRIDHCTIDCNTTVVGNRHSPGVAALRVQGATQSLEIDSNLITSSPQWGIKVSARETKGALLIHHNRVIGTHARVANGYMIGVHQPKAEVFENELSGESRGIHLDGIDANGHGAHIHDNLIRAQDQPNAEFPKHWCHGIKVEGPTSARIHDNVVVVLADAQHSEARALDLTLTGSRDVVITRNRFVGVSAVPQRAGLSIGWTDGFDSLATAGGLRFERNVCVATHHFLARSWESRQGATLRGNAWIRDTRLGAAAPFVFERFDNEDHVPSRGHRLADPVTVEDPTAVAQWASPGAYEAGRLYTMRIAVVDASGRAAAGAHVVIHDARHREVLSAETDARGIVAGEILMALVTPGPHVTKRGPFEIRVEKAGLGTYAKSFDVRGRFALQVSLAAGRGTVDVTAPEAPPKPSVYVVSASRAYVVWTASADASGIAAYLVSVDGKPAVICSTASCFLTGLTPATRHVVSIQAIDAAGLRSGQSAAVTFTTSVEDRGP